MSIIGEVHSLSSEVVIVEKQTTFDFKILNVKENIVGRRVEAEVELGPFTDTDGVVQGTIRRMICVWDNETYDAIRDTWTNADLIESVRLKLEN